MKRMAMVADQFYPGSKAQLIEQIESMIDMKAAKADAIAAISPHAGYMYSGSVAGAVFSRINIPHTVVLLGPNHTGFGAPFAVYKTGTWQTPIGDVGVDTELASMILDHCKTIKEDINAHISEHSLEVQLPFIQYLKKDVRIVPIVLGHGSFKDYQSIADAIAKSVKTYRHKVLIVASSDMTHYEPQDVASRKDNTAIKAILELDAGLLLERVEQHNITMCGVIPTAVMLIAAKALGARSARLIRYQTSGDVSGDMSSVVGYAGIIVR